MKYWTYAIQYAVYAYNRFPTTTEDGYMAPYEATYRGYYLGIHEPIGCALVYFIGLDSVGKGAHVIFDEVSELKRDVMQTREVQEERRVAGDFEYLLVGDAVPRRRR